ncbi:beta-ketoacyl-ACP synthase II [Miltoncostaea oceani]|jgi:3-oxoacyl-[acyl-carrier-protein] synthase II|uniref:beta-ketoacyl-ACP synthase II n=1 Tax=Miltoncostaea oceani TaxID=2843216 RepID=UPI001C3E8700|nr:beta-ketoacyl-ACP synthase II [Miltoncostaea oceani]
MSGQRRVVVTGLGIVSPLGIGWRDSWDAALAGTSTARTITRFDPVDHACKIACEVRGFDPDDHIDRRAARRMDRASQLAVAAARMAVEDAGLEIRGGGERAGAVISTGNGSSQTFEDNDAQLIARGPGRASPLMVPMTIVNMSAGHVSMQLGLRGPSSCVVTACASGNHGIGDASAIIRKGAADVMVAGGTEAGVTPFCMAGLDATRALSRRNDDPEHASRPFDRDRDGFVSAEGAGILVLESLEHALDRGAPIICELVGYGASSDAYHLTEPDPSGRWQVAAMRAALARGGLDGTDVDYVNAHGTSTGAGDPVEIGAIRQLVGDDRAPSVMVSSTKSMHGHGMGAAGGFEAVLTALAIREGRVPPTINVENLDPACAGVDHVLGESRATPVDVAISNSFGFGGHNAVLAFARYDA